MKILQIIPSLGTGGAEKMVLSLASGVSDQDHEVIIVSLYAKNDTKMIYAPKASTLSIIYLNKKPGFDIAMVYKIFKIIREFKPSIIHTHLHTMKYVLPLTFLRSFAWVHTVHNVAQMEANHIDKKINYISFLRGAVPVAIADKVRNTIYEVYRIKNTPVILNGIDLHEHERVSLGRDEWRRREGFSESDVIITAVGRLYKQKNHRLLISSFKEVSEQFPQTRLMIVGEGELRSDLQDYCIEKGLKDKVKFLGNRNDVPAILNAIDIFTISSDWEGNPLSLMEAIAAGCPVVCTAVGGIPEVVDPSFGLLVTAGDESALTKALKDMVESKEKRILMAQAAKAYSHQFSSSKMIDNYLYLYKKLTSRKVAR